MRNWRSTEDSPCLQPLIKAGAIIILKGNTSVGSSSMHTENLLWGRASNPCNGDRSCGDSSGGDAGLDGSRCIPLAIGSDVGGSIRVPSAFIGIVGFKPT